MPIYNVKVKYVYETEQRVMAKSEYEAMQMVEDCYGENIYISIGEDYAHTPLDYTATEDQNPKNVDFELISSDIPITIRDIEWGKGAIDEEDVYPDIIEETVGEIASEHVENGACELAEYQIEEIIREYIERMDPDRELKSFSYILG